MSSVTRSLIRYHGGKWRIAPWISSYFPDHCVYVEPFGGGAGVLLRKERCNTEIYNDLDKEIVNLFRAVRDNGDALRKKLELTPYSREEFILAYFPDDDSIEQARRTIVRAFMGFSSSSTTKGKACKGQNPSTGFRNNAPGRSYAKEWRTYQEGLTAIIKRLQGVVIENRPALELIMQNDSKDTLFYIDPPYLSSTRDDGSDYRFEMSENDHIELAKTLNEVKGPVIVSGYHSELYDELYNGWTRREKNTFADGALPRTEILWMKGIQPESDLFSGEDF